MWHLMAFLLCAPSIIRLLMISARGRPLFPESGPEVCLFRSGDRKSKGCLSGVTRKEEWCGSLSTRSVLSGGPPLPLRGVSGP